MYKNMTTHKIDAEVNMSTPFRLSLERQRKNLGITYVEIAQSAKVAPSTVSRTLRVIGRYNSESAVFWTDFLVQRRINELNNL